MDIKLFVFLELIRIGETKSLNLIGKISNIFPEGTSHAWELYIPALAKALNAEALINLFKGLVICEKELQWKCGSTTPAAHYYHHIGELGLDPDYSLADWAFQLSDNQYIPFGFIRRGNKTAYEYVQWREDLYGRLAREKEAKKERKRLQLERAKKIADEKKKRVDGIHALYSNIMGMSTSKQVAAIVADRQQLIYFYMPVIVSLLKRTDVTKGELDKLLTKLIEMKATPFRRKVTKLIEDKINSLTS